ncbi:MAG: PAS domain-containing protein [Rhodospirillaceae bacterium]|nr:PAS domain-containing protein [Rhodospirillaceae bacterium]
MFDSPLTAEYLAHWQSLRHDARPPTTEDYFDHISVRAAPLLLMFECTAADVTLRYQGTRIVQRWGKDRTGESWLAGKPPAAAAAILANMRDCVGHPCGAFSKSTYVTKHGRALNLESLTLPLTAADGRPGRLIALSNVQDPVDERDGGVGRVERNRFGWFDVGFGVPSHDVRQNR